MKKIGSAGLFLCLILILTMQSIVSAASAPQGDKTTKYRVYQNDSLLMEFADYSKAESYARGYSNSHVEEIGSRKWLWNNFPRYQVFQMDNSLPNWKFSKLEDAIAEASRWGYSSVRDLQGTGWVWNNYPRYRVYQGDITIDGWEFTNLNAAIVEAKRWGNSHIIDLSDNRWVWDNLTAANKNELRQGSKVYRVYQYKYTQDSWSFAYLEDAIKEALNWGNSTVVHTGNNNAVVFSNEKKFKVFQGQTYLEEYVSLDQAIAYARLWAGSSVRLGGKIIWNNYPTYTVYQNDKRIGEYFQIPDALSYAMKYSNSRIKNLDGTSIWDNYRKLQFWGWNGTSSKDTIMKQTAPTLGLDVDSPTWFYLADAEGNLNDSSSKETADWLRGQGYEVHPLVTNQFNPTLTTQFLASTAAQDKFIKALVDRCAQLQVKGINIDFESVSGKDRAAFTGFMTKLTDYAHTKGLKISVDLPRGSVKWNHQTAFDHEKLAGIVDYIITMTYDHHYSGSTVPGSVAGLQWVEEGIKEFLSYGIPRDKLLMGIPFYIREWTLDASGGLVSNRALYTRDLAALITEKKASKTWDARFNQYKVEYTADDGTKRVFWLEDEETVKARLELAKKYDLAGVAAWRLGQEPAGFWKTMIQVK